MADLQFKEIIKRLRNYEIRIRKAVNTRMHGDFHSVFKGSGLEFDDVRSYQYGDDVRAIDWNVSAKGHGAYIKTFKEEKEQTVFFLLDVSASQQIGKKGQQKMDVARDICGVLMLSALKESNQVGLICFSDIKEKYFKPEKGIKHSYQLISGIFNLIPKSLKTDISKAIGFLLNTFKRRSVVILISDFVDEKYEHNLQSLASKHDLVVVQVSEKREARFPRLGIIPLYDKELKKSVWVNTSSTQFRNEIQKQFVDNRKSLEVVCRKNNASYLQVYTNEDFVPKLIRLFQYRNVKRV